MSTTREALAAGFSVNGQGPDLEPPHPTDMGNATRFAKDHRGQALYVPEQGKWFLWDGRRWALDLGPGVIALAKATIRGIYAEAGYADDPKERRALAAHAVKSEQEARLRAAVFLAQSEPGMSAPADELDRDPFAFNVLNGTVDLKTGQVRQARREDLITKLAPVTFDSEAACPRWDAFLERILGRDADLTAFLRRACGYSLTGSTRERVLFLLWGTGRNGKSTFLRVLMDILGDYALKTPASTLMARKGDAIPNDVARLKGARFVVAVETDRERRLAEALVKELTGGTDKIAARFMRAEWFDFAPEFKLFLATNHKPVVKDTSEAIWDRIRLIPFAVRIPEAEKDDVLAETLVREEAAGILAWAVRGALEWQQGGLGVPRIVRQATATYRAEQDLLGGFLHERCHVDPVASVGATELYKAYVSWCEESGDKPAPQRTVGLALAERGFMDDRTKHGRYRTGLRLLEPDEEPDDASTLMTLDDADSAISAHARAQAAYSENPVTIRHPSPDPSPEWVRE